MATKNSKIEEVMYKEKPLVRRGDTLYYGFIDDKYIIKIIEKDSAQHGELNVGSSVTVQLTTNNSKKLDGERIIRQSTKDGLFDALDIGVIWLEEALEYQN